MRSVGAALILSIAVLFVAGIEELQPFASAIHHWQYTLGMALAGIYLSMQTCSLLTATTTARERFAALAALGGIVIAASFVAAELFVGPPQRVSAAPGQTYRPPGSAHLSLSFPPIASGTLSAAAPVGAIAIWANHAASDLLLPGQTRRIHSFVLRAQAWPAAYVVARSPQGKPQTVTQPTGTAFVSPVLQFPSTDADGLPVDEFAVPALHREVAVKYYPGLPARGIDIPFLQLQIKEENGGPLFAGVAVSGRPLVKAGVNLSFALGKYPIALMAGSPDALLYGCGAALIVVGTLAFMFSAPQRGIVASV